MQCKTPLPSQSCIRSLYGVDFPWFALTTNVFEEHSQVNQFLLNLALDELVSPGYLHHQTTRVCQPRSVHAACKPSSIVADAFDGAWCRPIPKGPQCPSRSH